MVMLSGGQSVQPGEHTIYAMLVNSPSGTQHAWISGCTANGPDLADSGPSSALKRWSGCFHVVPELDRHRPACF